MDIVEAILLGIVQGASEFLPISSSGHLVIVQRLLGVEEGSLTMSIAVHFGSLIAVVAALWPEWWLMLKALVGRAGEQNAAGRRLFFMLVLASLPVAVVGYLLKESIEAAFSSPYIPAVMLLVTGVLLWYADKVKGKASLGDLSIRHALTMGIGQSIALLPGLSRSGTTMAAGIFAGLRREQAARFSFLMAVPAIFGASLLEGIALLTGESTADLSLAVVLAGIIASLITSYIAIRFFLSFLRRGRLRTFAWYVWIVGALVLALTVLG